MKVFKLGGALLGAVLGFGAAVTAVSAQDAAANYPNKPIRVIVPFAAGGGNDIFARLVGQKLGEILGQTVVNENKPGAGGRIAAEYVMNQPHDGYTLFVGASGVIVGRGGCVSEPVVPSDQDIHSVVDDRRLPADPGDSGGSPGQDRQGTGRVGEEKSG